MSGHRSFPMSQCAFLRTKTDENGILTEAKCLLKHGEECCCAHGFPNGLPCQDAVRRSNRRKDQDKHYWDSVRKHHLKQDGAAHGKALRHNKMGNAFAAKGTSLQEYRFCKRKKRYADQKQAEENRKWCEAKRGVPLRVMYCPYCNGYHLTKKYAENRRLFEDSSRENAVKREIKAREEKQFLNEAAKQG